MDNLIGALEKLERRRRSSVFWDIGYEPITARVPPARNPREPHEPCPYQISVVPHLHYLQEVTKVNQEVSMALQYTLMSH